MNPSVKTSEQPVASDHVQPRDQYTRQVADESRPAASVLGEQHQDPAGTVTGGVFIP